MLSEVSKDDGIAVYDIDMFYVDPSDIAKLKAKNKIVICYFPAGSMQFSKRTSFTDPVEKTGPIPCDQRNLEPFREEMAPFLRNIQKQDVCGYVRDWPDNCWFDVRSKRVREAAERLILEAKSRGCDGVEFDNIDGGLDEENWTDARCPGKAANVPASRKEMEQAQLAFNRSIAEFARKNCLFAGLKNGHLVSQKQCPHFDFVIVESVLSEATKHPNDEDAAKSVRDWSACAEKGRPIFAAEYPEDFASYRCPNIPGYSITYFPNRRFVDGGVSCPPNETLKEKY